MAKCDSEWYDLFSQDPVNTRFPGGESYADFVRRLMPTLVEVEQQLEPVIVIAPLSTLQVLTCYFAKQHVCEACDILIPQHSVSEWKPDGGNFRHTHLSEDDLAAGAAASGGGEVPANPRPRIKKRVMGSIMFHNPRSEQKAEWKSQTTKD